MKKFIILIGIYKKTFYDKLFMEGETINVTGYYIDNHKKQKWTAKKIIYKKTINVKSNYIIEKQIPDGFTILDLLTQPMKVMLLNLN